MLSDFKGLDFGKFTAANTELNQELFMADGHTTVQKDSKNDKQDWDIQRAQWL